MASRYRGVGQNWDFKIASDQIQFSRQRPTKQLAREHRSFVAVLLIQIKAKELAERILGEAGAIFIPERAIAGAAGDDAHEVSEAKLEERAN